MRTAITTAPGRLELVESAVPEPGPGEVRVRVEWAAVNPVDRQTIEGVYRALGWMPAEGAAGLGWDASGVVDAIGDGVQRVRPGMPVAALSAGVDKPVGTFAEFVVVPEESLAPRPAGLAPDAAATIPLAGLTAWQALDMLGDPDGGTLLVTGAAGAVGGAALRLAVRRGWTVIGLGRESDRDFIEAAGATSTAAVPGPGSVSAVLDAAVLGDSALDAIADDGRYVGVMPPAVPEPRRGISTAAVNVAPDARQLEQLLALAEAGDLEARIASRWPLAEIAEAVAASAAPGARGKVLVRAGVDEV